MSDNTGGPASQNTLRDEFAGRALAWCLSEFAGNAEDGTQYAEAAYQIADSMLAEKARREGVVKESSTTADAGDTLRRLAADVLPADIRDAAGDEPLGWCAEQVRAHVNTLTERNRELVEALERFVDNVAVFVGNSHPEVSSARAILAKHKGAA